MYAISCFDSCLFSMDANAIDLDNLDNSDISSGWNSSEDEAPQMEVENERPTAPAEPTDYEAERVRIETMESEEEPDTIPRKVKWRS